MGLGTGIQFVSFQNCLHGLKLMTEYFTWEKQIKSMNSKWDGVDFASGRTKIDLGQDLRPQHISVSQAMGWGSSSTSAPLTIFLCPSQRCWGTEMALGDPRSSGWEDGALFSGFLPSHQTLSLPSGTDPCRYSAGCYQTLKQEGLQPSSVLPSWAPYRPGQVLCIGPDSQT